MLSVSVILPTHNPDKARLERTIEGLKNQSLPKNCWELIIVDNASSNKKLFDELDLSWHLNARVVREEKLGLTAARLCGFKEAKSQLIIMVDDDNILHDKYLECSVKIAADHERIGAFGGKVIPEYEIEPEAWIKEFSENLALRNYGEDIILTEVKSKSGGELKKYPDHSPVGAGMVLRKECALKYSEVLKARGMEKISDRSGEQLTSGGDNDLVLTILEDNYQIGYFPQLSLVHLIPAARLTPEYFGRLLRGIAKSWVQLLDLHGIRPWRPVPKWQVLPLKIRSYFRHKAWMGPAAYIRWQQSCGMYEGQSELH